MKVATRYDVPKCGVDCPECGAKILAPHAEMRPDLGRETVDGHKGVAFCCARCGKAFLIADAPLPPVYLHEEPIKH